MSSTMQLSIKLKRRDLISARRKPPIDTHQVQIVPRGARKKGRETFHTPANLLEAKVGISLVLRCACASGGLRAQAAACESGINVQALTLASRTACTRPWVLSQGLLMLGPRPWLNDTLPSRAYVEISIMSQREPQSSSSPIVSGRVSRIFHYNTANVSLPPPLPKPPTPKWVQESHATLWT